MKLYKKSEAGSVGRHTILLILILVFVLAAWAIINWQLTPKLLYYINKAISFGR